MDLKHYTKVVLYASFIVGTFLVGCWLAQWTLFAYIDAEQEHVYEVKIQQVETINGSTAGDVVSIHDVDSELQSHFHRALKQKDGFLSDEGVKVTYDERLPQWLILWKTFRVNSTQVIATVDYKYTRDVSHDAATQTVGPMLTLLVWFVSIMSAVFWYHKRRYDHAPV